MNGRGSGLDGLSKEIGNAGIGGVAWVQPIHVVRAGIRHVGHGPIREAQLGEVCANQGIPLTALLAVITVGRVEPDFTALGEKTGRSRQPH